MYTDKKLICRDCGNEFVFTAGEQEFYNERGFDSVPQRCRFCRQKRRYRDRQKTAVKPALYEIVCARCGSVDTITYEPRHDRPVYCRECYRKIMQEQKR